jgi:hypothetical protein
MKYLSKQGYFRGDVVVSIPMRTHYLMLTLGSQRL